MQRPYSWERRGSRTQSEGGHSESLYKWNIQEWTRVHVLKCTLYLSQVQGEVHSSEFFSLRQWWRLPGSSYISVNSGARWVASLTLAGIANVAGASRSAECCFYRIFICVPATFSRRLYCSAAQVKRNCETVRRR